MSEFSGILYINETDVYDSYGAYLADEKERNHKNYDSLMKPPKIKSHTVVNFREQDGEKYPDVLMPRWEARDVELRFALVASGATEFLQKSSDFINMLKVGNNGWLLFRFPELDNKLLRMFYKESSDWSQLTYFDTNEVAATIRVKFREPNPVF